MALTCEQLIDEVKDFIGRPTDTALVTDTRVMRWLNEAQVEIADAMPGIPSLEVKNTASVDFTVQLAYNLYEWTTPLNHAGDSTTTNYVCHIKDAWYIDGADSVKLKFMPVDDFDREYPDPTDSDFGTGKPQVYTRRRNKVEVAPTCATEYCDKTFRLDFYTYPRDFTATTSSETSDLENADDGLIAYAVYKSWNSIGGEKGLANATYWKARYDEWADTYREKQFSMQAWEANIYE